MRSETLEKLGTAASKAKILFVGSKPAMIGGSSLVEKDAPLFADMQVVENAAEAILAALASYRDIDIFKSDGTRAERYLYQLREEETAAGCSLHRHGRRRRRGASGAGAAGLGMLRTG